MSFNDDDKDKNAASTLLWLFVRRKAWDLVKILMKSEFMKFFIQLLVDLQVFDSIPGKNEPKEIFSQ